MLNLVVNTYMGQLRQEATRQRKRVFLLTPGRLDQYVYCTYLILAECPFLERSQEWMLEIIGMESSFTPRVFTRRNI